MFVTFSDLPRPLTRSGSPAFIEKVWDARYGTALRDVIYVAQYDRDYTYFKFTIKKNRGGWLISNFEFKNEPAKLFPPGYVTPIQ
jgi:hypothetical protein